jgi:hypothetical protein
LWKNGNYIINKKRGNKQKSIPVSSLLSQDGKIHHKRNADDNGDLSKHESVDEKNSSKCACTTRCTVLGAAKD